MPTRHHLVEARPENCFTGAREIVQWGKVNALQVLRAPSEINLEYKAKE